MRILFLSFLFFGSLFNGSPGQAKTLFVNIGTGGITGVYYPTGGAITKILNQSQGELQIKAIVEPTCGAVFNINAVLGGHLLFGLAQSDRQYQAVNGEADWTAKGPQNNLRSVFSLYPEVVTLIAAADSGIRTVADLRGKKVSIGDIGSGYRQNALDALTAAGLDPLTDLSVFNYKVPLADTMLQAGQVDAFFYTVGHPNHASNTATRGSRKVRFVEIPINETFLADKPYYQKTVIPVSFYPAVANTENVESFAVQAGLITTDNASENLVYTVTKEIFENFEDFKNNHPAYTKLNKKDMIQGNSPPLHSGALKYYREVGLLP